MKEVLSKSPWMYVLLFLIVALIMTVYEVIKEAVFKGALTPWQSHTITILVTSFLAAFATVSIRSWSENILKKEQILRLQQQNIHTLNLTLKAVHHIVNNFLVHFDFIKRDLKEGRLVRKETLEILDSSMQKVIQQLKILEELKEPDKEESYKGIYPE